MAAVVCHYHILQVAGAIIEKINSIYQPWRSVGWQISQPVTSHRIVRCQACCRLEFSHKASDQRWRTCGLSDVLELPFPAYLAANQCCLGLLAVILQYPEDARIIIKKFSESACVNRWERWNSLATFTIVLAPTCSWLIDYIWDEQEKGGHNLSSWQPRACSCQLSISALTLQDQSYEAAVVSPPAVSLYPTSCMLHLAKCCFLWSFITTLNLQHVDRLDFSTQSRKRDLLHWEGYLICFDNVYNRACYEPSTKWYGTFMLRCQLHQEGLTCD